MGIPSLNGGIPQASLGVQSYSVLDEDQLEQLKAIASVAKGSGLFEGSNGGEGFMGAFTDRLTGQTHYVKMLTHRSERKAVRELGEAAFIKSNKPEGDSIKEISNRLFADLQNLAKSVGAGDGLMNLFGYSGKNQYKTLMSRKFVAQAVSLISQAHNKNTVKNAGGSKFSWNDLDVAATENNTTKAAILKYVKSRENAYTQERFAQMRGKIWGENRFSAAMGKLGSKCNDDASKKVLKSLEEGKIPDAWMTKLRQSINSSQKWCLLEGCDDSEKKEIDRLNEKVAPRILKAVLRRNGELGMLECVLKNPDELERLLKQKLVEAEADFVRNSDNVSDDVKKIYSEPKSRVSVEEKPSQSQSKYNLDISDVSSILSKPRETSYKGMKPQSKEETQAQKKWKEKLENPQKTMDLGSLEAQLLKAQKRRDNLRAQGFSVGGVEAEIDTMKKLLGK